jgi:hypothetical protein
MSKMLSIALGAALTLAGHVTVQAAPIQPIATDASMITQVADGCGVNKYRGPYGSCHRFGTGPYPKGYHGPNLRAARAHACPPGYWHGPWGHCRDTPYHGRLPGGGWK